MGSFAPLQPTAASGAKLAALFSSDDSANVSLQFKAPRAPRAAALMKPPASDPAASRPADATGANPGIAFASTCHLFRFYEGGYQAVHPPGGTGEDGSVGIVVMGTGQDDKMRILCYDKAKAQIMAAGISGQLDVIPQHGLYLSLKDDAGAVWSIRFKSEEDLLNATRAIVLARSTNWTASDYPLVMQDAVPGQEGERATVAGDSVSIQYMAWLESPQGRGILGSPLPGAADAPLEAEFSVGRGAAIAGWEEGVLDMRAGGVRWLVLPPNLAYGDEGKEEAGIPPGAVLIFRIRLMDVRKCEPSLDAPIPAMGEVHGGVTIAAAIKTLRPPSESEAEDDGEWEEEPVGGAEVAVPNDESARRNASDEDTLEESSVVEAARTASRGEEHGTDGIVRGGDGGVADEGSEGSEVDIKLRMARLAEQGGIRHQLGDILSAPPAHHQAGGAPVWGENGVGDSGAGGGVYGGGPGIASAAAMMAAYGGPAPGGFLAESLAASRKVQEELAGSVREVKGGMEEVRSKVDRLLEQADRKSSGSADLLVGEVLVQSIQKLVLDNDSLRSDAVRLRERVQEGAYSVQKLEEEKRRLEQLLEEQTTQFVTSSSAGETAEALKLQAVRLQAEADTARKEADRLQEEQASLQHRLDAALADAREHKQRCKNAEEKEAAAVEQLEEAAAARERAESERKKLRQEFTRERERWQEELEEERAGVDRNIKELRDCVRRLRVEGAGAAEAEMDELQAKLEAQSKEREDALLEQLAQVQEASREAQQSLQDFKTQADQEREKFAAQARADVEEAREREACRSAVELRALEEKLVAVEALAESRGDEIKALQEAARNERDESAAREEAVAEAAKRRIDKVKESAKAQVPAKLKEVASAVYFKLEDALQELSETQTSWAKDEVLALVLDTLKSATLEVTGERGAAAEPSPGAVSGGGEEGADAEAAVLVGDGGREPASCEVGGHLEQAGLAESEGLAYEEDEEEAGGVAAPSSAAAGVGAATGAHEGSVPEGEVVGRDGAIGQGLDQVVEDGGAVERGEGEEEAEDNVGEKTVGLEAEAISEDAVREVVEGGASSSVPPGERVEVDEAAAETAPGADEAGGAGDGDTSPSTAPGPKGRTLFGDEQEEEEGGRTLVTGSAGGEKGGRKTTALFREEDTDSLLVTASSAGKKSQKSTSASLFGDDDGDDSFLKSPAKAKGVVAASLFGDDAGDDAGGLFATKETSGDEAGGLFATGDADGGDGGLEGLAKKKRSSKKKR